MEILQFMNELNFEFTEDDNLMQKLRKFYTADCCSPEIIIDGEIIHIKIEEKSFRTVQRGFEKAMDFCNLHEFDKGEKVLKKINTVERLQGQDVRLIILSFAVSDPEYYSKVKSFLLNPNRLNVMISRAKEKDVILRSSDIIVF